MLICWCLLSPALLSALPSFCNRDDIRVFFKNLNKTALRLLSTNTRLENKKLGFTQVYLQKFSGCPFRITASKQSLRHSFHEKGSRPKAAVWEKKERSSHSFLNGGCLFGFVPKSVSEKCETGHGERCWNQLNFNKLKIINSCLWQCNTDTVNCTTWHHKVDRFMSVNWDSNCHAAVECFAAALELVWLQYRESFVLSLSFVVSSPKLSGLYWLASIWRLSSDKCFFY